MGGAWCSCGVEPRRDGPGKPFDQYYAQTPTHSVPTICDRFSRRTCVKKEAGIAPFQTPALLLDDHRLLVQVVKNNVGWIVNMKQDGTDAG